MLVQRHGGRLSFVLGVSGVRTPPRAHAARRVVRRLADACADAGPTCSSLNNRRPSPQYLLEDELEAAQEPAENYLEELPAPLPAALAYTGPPLYDLLDLGDLLARRPVRRRRRTAESAPPAA